MADYASDLKFAKDTTLKSQMVENQNHKIMSLLFTLYFLVMRIKYMAQ